MVVLGLHSVVAISSIGDWFKRIADKSESTAHQIMSIAEFLDGCPSFDKKNFNNFVPKNVVSKSSPVYITTREEPSDQTIANDNSHLLIPYLHKQWDKTNGCKKRALVETSEEYGSTSRKRPRVDDIDFTL